MHRIDGPGATVDNRFTEGNPATAVPATEVTDDWLNDVQEELISILTAAGITPEKGTQNQVLEALTELFGLNVTTPPQFDNGTSIATTAFVQRALGNDSGVVIVAANRTMTAADAGKYLFSNANSLVYTLPDPAALPLGTKFRIAQGNLTSGGSINAPGSVTIGNITHGGTVTSVAMAQSTEYVLTVVSGTAYQLTVIAAGGIGVNQSWQDVTGSRTYDVNYTNTTTRPIQVTISHTLGSGTNGTFVIDGVTVLNIAPTGFSQTLSVVVPVGKVYRFNGGSGSKILSSWAELR